LQASGKRPAVLQAIPLLLLLELVVSSQKMPAVMQQLTAVSTTLLRLLQTPLAVAAAAAMTWSNSLMQQCDQQH
jgi:hypothetical protein